jgi:hypothetical protein
MHSYFANKVSNLLCSRFKPKTRATPPESGHRTRSLRTRGAAATDSFARAQIDRYQDQEDHSARAHSLKKRAATARAESRTACGAVGDLALRPFKARLGSRPWPGRSRLVGTLQLPEKSTAEPKHQSRRSPWTNKLPRQGHIHRVTITRTQPVTCLTSWATWVCYIQH